MTDEEFAALYPTMSNRELGKLMDRTRHTVRRRARRLGLTKPEGFRRWVNAGERCWSWKGGVSYVQTGRARTPEHREWRALVLARDDYTCQMCGWRSANGRLLRAHHVKPWADYPELRLAVSNGQTLCVICHAEVHGVKVPEARQRKLCACGCGDLTSPGRTFVWGHIARVMTRRPKTPEERAAISERQRGRTLPDAWRASLSAARKGERKSDAHREKLRQANLGRRPTPEMRAASVAKTKGKPLSAEHRAKIAAGVKAARQRQREAKAQLS